LKHAGGVDPAMKPRVHADLDHPFKAVAVPLEQVGQRPAIPGSEPLEQVDAFTGWVVHDLAHTYMTGARPLIRDKKNGEPLPQCRVKVREIKPDGTSAIEVFGVEKPEYHKFMKRLRISSIERT